MGIEDFESADNRRLISCTRNLFAGVLLLFKHRLSEMSPAGSDEVLIKQNVLPVETNGQVVWQGEGKKTVDVRQIQERFQSLRIDVDWTRIGKINRYRNDVEHYFSSLSHSAVQTLIQDCFVVIRDFVRNELHLEPLDIFDPETWGVFTNVAEVFQKEKAQCVLHIRRIDWKYDVLTEALVDCTCRKCGSGLLEVDPNNGSREAVLFTCLSCGDESDFEAMTNRAIGHYFAGENHNSVRDGGSPSTIDCPECRNETYLLDDDVCVFCEESVNRTCERCCCEIPPEELDGGGLCGYCAHMMSKDD